MTGDKLWRGSLIVLIKFHVRGIDLYRAVRTPDSDDQISDFVIGNMGTLGAIYRWGIWTVLFILNVLSVLISGRPIWNLQEAEADRVLQNLVHIFPFDVLNRLVCGNIFMKMFELESMVESNDTKKSSRRLS